jgi:heat-inducible transcriptional repressor
MSHNKDVNERAQYILKVLIERYIREGQPVGSRAIAADSPLALSPATIRNVMAELEAAGYVSSPHTSAGRVPTARGYRLFVDSLVTVKPLNAADICNSQQELNPNQDVNQLVLTTSRLLSQLTQFAGVVTVPRREKAILRQIEFLPLSDNRLLVILVVNQREVQNRIINLTRTYTASDLQQMSNYLTTTFAGQDLSQVRTAILAGLESDSNDLQKLMQSVIDLAGSAFALPAAEEDYVLAGTDHLLEITTEQDVCRLRSLFEAFNRKRDILQLLDHCLTAEGVQIFIGQESGYSVFDDYSIVTAPYTVEGNKVGVLGVIGPKRMPYDRVIPVVDVTAKLLSSALTKHA